MSLKARALRRGLGALVALTLIALAQACAPSPDFPMASTPRFLALGDSYTIGEGVEPEARWTHRLAATLRAEGVDVPDPETIAQTGWTVDELEAGMDAASPQGPYALVTVLAGVNDQYRGRPVEAYRPAFRALLVRALGLAGGEPGRLVVVSIPDWGRTPFAQALDGDEALDPERVAAEIDAYNAAARAEADALGAYFVDVTDLSREPSAALAADGLHPGSEAYGAWADRVLPAARAALSVQPSAEGGAP